MSATRYVAYREAANCWSVWSLGLSGSRQECVAQYDNARKARAVAKKLSNKSDREQRVMDMSNVLRNKEQRLFASLTLTIDTLCARHGDFDPMGPYGDERDERYREYRQKLDEAILPLESLREMVGERI